MKRSFIITALNRLFLILVVFIFENHLQLCAQPYHNLVFEGAGIKGLAYAGAIAALEERQLMEGITHVAGTSAGAITALALALGYEGKEIEALIYNTKFQKFNDGRFFFVGGISRMNRKYGWYRGDKFVGWLEEMINAKTGNPDITFREMEQAGYRKLYVTGTSLNRQTLMVFSHETYPDMKVKDAVRISMSVPLYYRAVFIDSTGTIVQKPGEGVDIMVDGGITGNFPINVFDRQSGKSGDRIVNHETLGLRIDVEDQINYDMDGKGLSPYAIDGFKDYIGAFYKYVIENLNRGILSEEDWQRTISISSADIGPKVKRLSKAQKDLLIANGRKAVSTWFKPTHSTE
ncbi:MAG: patatin-like phospholipase family protein [Cyclobacteriaceae bacterium]|nr:patatin-like phospholipase family protein [Cyclobacteriaceae bacterium]